MPVCQNTTFFKNFFRTFIGHNIKNVLCLFKKKHLYNIVTLYSNHVCSKTFLFDIFKMLYRRSIEMLIPECLNTIEKYVYEMSNLNDKVMFPKNVWHYICVILQKQS